MLRNLPDRSRSFIATLFGRSAGPKRRRPARSRRRPIGAEQLESRAMLATTATLSGTIAPFTRIPVTFLRADGSVGFSNTAYVGQLSWSGMTGTAAGLGVPASFRSFCIDGLQGVAPGSNTFAEVRPIAASSLLGTPRAGLLADFWRQYGPADASGFTDNTDSAAFQIAVWEIINDGRTAGPAGTRLAFDLAAGQFSVNPAGRSLPATLRAEQWLAGFDTTAPARASVVLYALESPTRQDQVVCVPSVDLDVDSDNSGSVARSTFEDGIEDDTTRPGLIVPVGVERARMIVDVPNGQSATPAFDAAAAAKVKVFSNSGAVVLEQGRLSTAIAGGTTAQTFWIEAFAPSASLADIAFTLTPAGGSPASSDTIRATAVAVDLDVDSNNDGTIDPDNGPAGTDDRIEEPSPGQIIFANTDDDDRNGVADALDAGPIAAENDLAPVLLAVAPAASFASIVVTYDESVVRLYAHPDRRGPIASGVVTATGGRFYAEGRSAGTTLVTAAFPNAGPVTDTVRLTVQPYPGTIDVDIDSDNNNGFLRPARSEWEDILEDHEYGIGKLIMLDNPNRPLTPIVMELPTGLPKNAPTVGVRVDWNATGVAGQVQLWNRVLADGVRNPAPVSEGGDQILAGIFCRLSDLNYNPTTGTITIWAEGIRENA